LQTPDPLTRTLPRAAWILLAVAFLAAWFSVLGSRALVGPDEGRYAEIAREMSVTGDYVTPRLNDLKYFEKPPLQYWLTAAAFKAFGVREWTARLAPAIGGLIAVAAVGLTLSVLATPLAGAYAALVMASCVMGVAMSHFITLDALLTGWMAVALCAFLLAQQSNLASGRVRTWMLVVYAALAAATLTKGPVALVLAGGSLVVYSLITRDTGPWKRLYLLPGLLLYLILTVPWFVLVSRANPEFAHFFFIHEHVERFLTTEHHRPGAWYYFAPIFGFGIMPWLFLWFATFLRSWRESMPGSNGFDWMRFCFIWAFVVFGFFSMSGSKLPSYIFPEYPAIALLLGWELTRASQRTLFVTTLLHAVVVASFLGFMLFGFGPLIPSMSNAESPAELFVNFAPWLTAAGWIFVTAALIALYFFRQPGNAARTFGVIALAASGLVGFQTAFLGHEAFRTVRSTYDIVQMADSPAAGGPIDRSAPIFQVGMYEQTFPFYLGRPTTIVNVRDELALGLDAEPEKAYKSYELWVPAWTALTKGYALMEHPTYDYLRNLGVPMRIIASDPRRVFVARH
jgi:4-amino-4-deoxy-L-arabinose transferase-like glycosyltransferase